MQSIVLVGLGGGIGAVARFLLSSAVGRFWTAPFPLATLVVNILGSLLMGLVIGGVTRALPQLAEEARLFLGVGVLGGFTTFSSFSLETVTLMERGLIGQAALYILLSVAVSVPALYLGLMITRGLAP
jgi:CrcB protein